jgi:hypothetical protein
MVTTGENSQIECRLFPNILFSNPVPVSGAEKEQAVQLQSGGSSVMLYPRRLNAATHSPTEAFSALKALLWDTVLTREEWPWTSAQHPIRQ